MAVEAVALTGGGAEDELELAMATTVSAGACGIFLKNDVMLFCLESGDASFFFPAEEGPALAALPSDVAVAVCLAGEPGVCAALAPEDPALGEAVCSTGAMSSSRSESRLIAAADLTVLDGTAGPEPEPALESAVPSACASAPAAPGSKCVSIYAKQRGRAAGSAQVTSFGGSR